MIFKQAIHKIEIKLKNYKPRKLSLPGFVPAAVLIPFFNNNSEAYILFTLRTDTVEHHKGQVSFPGGAREPQDASLKETAVRETYEEIGSSEEKIQIIGELDDFPTVTNFMVTPFVGIIPYPYPFRINTDEVARILEVPLDIFLTNEFFEVKEKEYKGQVYPVYYYHYQDVIIWGATAYIMNRFVELIFEFNPAPASILRDPRNKDYLLENMYRSGKK